jgi:hypothetical protein
VQAGTQHYLSLTFEEVLENSGFEPMPKMEDKWKNSNLNESLVERKMMECKLGKGSLCKGESAI